MEFAIIGLTELLIIIIPVLFFAFIMSIIIAFKSRMK